MRIMNLIPKSVLLLVSILSLSLSLFLLNEKWVDKRKHADRDASLKILIKHHVSFAAKQEILDEYMVGLTDLKRRSSMWFIGEFVDKSHERNNKVKVPF